ncbi:MAG: D-Ala-D-Ala carboxypeptidase family metallohydrolase [Bacteroidota bacterium]
MIEISEHISWKEATKSQTAVRHGIKNEPRDIDTVFNMQAVARQVFERVREYFGNKPIAVTSFYRGPEVNHLVGGSWKSQHLKGEALDIDADVFAFPGITNQSIFEYIRNHLTFDQLISEYPDEKGNPSWVHVSFKREGTNRMEVLVAKKVFGRTQYSRL